MPCSSAAIAMLSGIKSTSNVFTPVDHVAIGTCRRCVWADRNIEFWPAAKHQTEVTTFGAENEGQCC